MSNKVNLEGNRFGRLLVIKYHDLDKSKRATWECKCECGKTKIASSKLLLNGKTRSCGCLRSELVINTYTKHGHSKAGQHSPEFTAWMNIKGRCYDVKNSHYKYYGARGIIMCPKWLLSFDYFLADVGYRPSENHSIDRWPDMNGNYEPGNVRWATSEQQRRNKTSNRWIEYNGEKLIITDWAKKLHVNSTQILYFLRRGLHMDEIINYFKSTKYAKKKNSRNKHRSPKKP